MLGGVAESFVHSPIKAGPIAKKTRIHADRPRHPWRERFALRAGLYGAVRRFIAVVCASLKVLLSPGLLRKERTVVRTVIAVVSANLNIRFKFSAKKAATNLHKGDKGGQWSKAYAAWMRRPRLQGCIHADFT